MAHHLPHHVYAGVPLHPHLTHDAGHLVWQSSVFDLRYQPRLQLRYQVNRPVQHLLRGEGGVGIENVPQPLHFFLQRHRPVFLHDFPGAPHLHLPIVDWSTHSDWGESRTTSALLG